MPLSSLFRASPPVRRPTPAAVEWRKNDFMAYTVGHDEQAVMLRGRVPQRWPGFVVDFVNSCDDFGPLENHLASYADKHAWGGLELEALRSWLPRVTEAQLLVSTADVISALARHTAPPPPPISAIGFPTGGARVDLVGRALESFARNARAFDRRVDFLISDGSAAPEHRAAFREAGRKWAREWEVPVRYAGEEEKRMLAAELVRRGLPASAVEFALFDPLGSGFSCGANRNALLLHEAGRMFCSIDDDAVCDLAAVPATSARLKLFSSCDPFTRWLFGDEAAAEAHAGKVEADFLGAHESLLGRGLAEIGAGLTVEALDATQAGDEVLRRLWTAEARVRASFTGHVGDPGVPTSVYYLHYEGENRRRLTETEAAYRAALANRSVFALAPSAAVGDASTSPGMAMGLDHRELLPPFFPVLHAEDFTWGATLWQSVAHAFLGHAPLAIRHRPRPGKTILQPGDLGPDRRAVIFEFSHLIRRVILRFPRHESAPPEERIRQLGRHLTALAAQPSVDFVEFLRSQILEHESGKLDYLEETLREDLETPDYWRDDLEAYLAHVREALTHDDFDIPFDLKGERTAVENRVFMQQLFARFGELLEVWPEMVAAARAINVSLDWMPRL